MERRFGWDTHGVPIEYEIDKKLGMSGKAAVEKLGIAEYNSQCRAIVMRYASEWRSTITRLGRWIDFDNDYKVSIPFSINNGALTANETMNLTFMESVWWVFKQMHEKGEVYHGYKVMPYSTALNTPVSNFEAAQNYKDVQDPAVVITFPLLDDPETSLLAWTTTPWTLPSHTSLAAHPDLEYIKIHDEDQKRNFILMESLLHTLYKDPKKAKFKILERFKGSHMKGWKYEPPFRYFYDKFKDFGFRVINATYVTADSGVGIVHQSPAFGAEDYNVAFSEGIISADRLPPNPVDEYGCFTHEVVDFANTYVKDADKAIIKNLKERSRLVVDSRTTHSYPFCWRSACTTLSSRPMYADECRIRHSCIKPFPPGLSRSSISFLRCSRTLKNPTGSQRSSRRNDLPIGLRTRLIGTSREIDSGAPLSPSGSMRTCPRLLLSVVYKSLKS